MTPEQKIEQLEQALLNQRAAGLVQAAEIVALRAVLHSLDTALRAVLPSSRRQSFDEAFLAQRKAALQTLLLREPDKALAARLSEQLESPSLNFPVDWD